MVSRLITLVSNLVSLKAQSLVPCYFSSTLMILSKIIKSNVNFFADDTMLFSVVNNPSSICKRIESRFKSHKSVGLSVEDEI